MTWVRVKMVRVRVKMVRVRVKMVRVRVRPNPNHVADAREAEAERRVGGALQVPLPRPRGAEARVVARNAVEREPHRDLG